MVPWGGSQKSDVQRICLKCFKMLMPIGGTLCFRSVCSNAPVDSIPEIPVPSSSNKDRASGEERQPERHGVKAVTMYKSLPSSILAV